jgi:hypothetical protein
MNELLAIERVIGWAQRADPQPGTPIVTLDGITWYECIHDDYGAGRMFVSVKLYQGASKRGIYLGGGLVASVRIEHTEPPPVEPPKDTKD